MVFRYKRFYLWGSVSILGILILIAPFIKYYYGYEEEIYCGDTCWVEFCIKNGNKNLYFYNKEELPLTFYPEDKVSNVKFYKKDGRYRSGYREIDFITPYYKGRKYVFKIPAYSTTCYAMEIEKEWWADVKWTFGKLDPMLLSGVQVGDKLVKEMCNPVYKTWTDKIPHYKTCTTKEINHPNGTIEKAYNYTCLDYIKNIPHINEQVDCTKTGRVNVSGEIIAYENLYCKLDRNKVCCIHNREGGQYGAWQRTDDSVTKWCRDLITNKETFDNSLKISLKEVKIES